MAKGAVTSSLKTTVKKLRAGIEKKHGKTVDQLRLERDKRINDTIRMNVPDRIPVTIQTGVFACKYADIPLSAMYYDPVAYWEACVKTIVDFEPDTGGMAGVGSFRID